MVSEHSDAAHSFKTALIFLVSWKLSLGALLKPHNHSIVGFVSCEMQRSPLMLAEEVILLAVKEIGHRLIHQS